MTKVSPVQSSDRCPTCRSVLLSAGQGKVCPMGDSCEPALIEVVREKFVGYIISSVLRVATKEEIETVEKLYQHGQCPHTLVTDKPGWLYDVRTCVTCGKGLGLI